MNKFFILRNQKKKIYLWCLNWTITIIENLNDQKRKV